MLQLVDVITSAASITPRSMKVEKLAQPTSYQRPDLGLVDLQELEKEPIEINEDIVLAEQDRLGEMTIAAELATELMSLRKKQRKQQLKIHAAGHSDRKDAIAAAATVTQRNGEFARMIQSAQFADRKEEAFTMGYQRLRGDAVSMF